MALLPHHALEDALAVVPVGLVLRHVNHGHSVASGRGKHEAVLLRRLGEELVRELNQDARAVARVRLAATRAAMVEVDENLDALLDDLVGLLALHVHDEADAAGIVLELRVVKSLLGRQSLPPRLRAHLLVVHRHWLAGIHPGMENFPRYQKGWFSLVAPKKRGDGNKPLRGAMAFYVLDTAARMVARHVSRVHGRCSRIRRGCLSEQAEPGRGESEEIRQRLNFAHPRPLLIRNPCCRRYSPRAGRLCGCCCS